MQAPCGHRFGAADGRQARLTVFNFRYTFEDAGVFGDDVDKRVSGAVAGLRMPWKGQWVVEPFWFGYRDDRATWGGRTGREERDFMGVRLRGRGEALTMDSVGIWQRGDFEARDISAYAFHTNWSWRLGDSALQPQLGFHADIATGGGAYGNGTIRSSSFLFGVAPYYSYATYTNGTNTRVLAPMFSLSPGKTTKIALEWEILRRDRQDDAIYNALGAPYAGTERVPGRDVGNLYRLALDWRLSRYLALSTQIEYLQAGNVLKRAGYDDGTFAMTSVTFRF